MTPQMAFLQVALDFLRADEALKVSAMTQDYVDIIEQAHLLLNLRVSR